jgi:hypothetical protein
VTDNCKLEVNGQLKHSTHPQKWDPGSTSGFSWCGRKHKRLDPTHLQEQCGYGVGQGTIKLNSTDSFLIGAGAAIDQCARENFQGCDGDDWKGNNNSGAPRVTTILIIRDPREVAISAYFYFGSKPKTELSKYMVSGTVRQTLQIAWRYKMAELAGPERVSLIMYNDFKCHVGPYLELCRRFGLHCPYSLLKKIMTGSSVDEMKGKSTGNLLGQSGDTTLKIRSGHRTVSKGYNFSSILLEEMDRFVTFVQPRSLTAYTGSIAVV